MLHSQCAAAMHAPSLRTLLQIKQATSPRDRTAQPAAIPELFQCSRSPTVRVPTPASWDPRHGVDRVRSRTLPRVGARMSEAAGVRHGDGA